MSTCKHLMFKSIDKDSTIEFCIDDRHGIIDISLDLSGDTYGLNLSEDESRRLVQAFKDLT